MAQRQFRRNSDLERVALLQPDTRVRMQLANLRRLHRPNALWFLASGRKVRRRKPAVSLPVGDWETNVGNVEPSLEFDGRPNR